jgi:hypothetical protein
MSDLTNINNIMDISIKENKFSVWIKNFKKDFKKMNGSYDYMSYLLKLENPTSFFMIYGRIGKDEGNKFLNNLLTPTINSITSIGKNSQTGGCLGNIETCVILLLFSLFFGTCMLDQSDIRDIMILIEIIIFKISQNSANISEISYFRENIMLFGGGAILGLYLLHLYYENIKNIKIDPELVKNKSVSLFISVLKERKEITSITTTNGEELWTTLNNSKILTNLYKIDNDLAIENGSNYDFFLENFFQETEQRRIEDNVVKDAQRQITVAPSEKNEILIKSNPKNAASEENERQIITAAAEEKDAAASRAAAEEKAAASRAAAEEKAAAASRAAAEEKAVAASRAAAEEKAAASRAAAVAAAVASEEKRKVELVNEMKSRSESIMRYNKALDSVEKYYNYIKKKDIMYPLLVPLHENIKKMKNFRDSSNPHILADDSWQVEANELINETIINYYNQRYIDKGFTHICLFKTKLYGFVVYAKDKNNEYHRLYNPNRTFNNSGGIGKEIMRWDNTFDYNSERCFEINKENLRAVANLFSNRGEHTFLIDFQEIESPHYNPYAVIIYNNINSRGQRGGSKKNSSKNSKKRLTKNKKTIKQNISLYIK